MGDVMDMILRMNKRAAVEVSNIESEMIETVNSFKLCRDEILKKLSNLQNNHNQLIYPNTPAYNKSRSSKRIVETSSEDENDDCTRVKLHNTPPETIENTKPKRTTKVENIENTSTKSKRGAAKAASENIKKASNMKLNSKMRRPSNEENIKSKVFDLHSNIKTEKRSEILEETPKHHAALSDVTNTDMPPPTTKPKRTRKNVKKEIEDIDTPSSERVTRSKRTRVKEEPVPAAATTKSTRNTRLAVHSPERKDSDVQIQEVPITVVVLTDSESENEKSSAKPIVEEVDEGKNKQRTGKRTKTKNKMTTKIKEEKQSVAPQEEPKNNTQSSIQEVSVYEDALTLEEQLKVPKPTDLNQTHVINNKNTSGNSPAIIEKIKETGVQLNCTVVLESIHSTQVKQVEPNLNDTRILPKKPTIETNNSDLLTDDDDSIDVAVPVEKTPNKKVPVNTKPIFSPYGNSPVKKRVAAFEKLADAPTRVTRTKTRILAANTETTPPDTQSNRVIAPHATITKPKKPYTPLTNNKLPSMISQSENRYKTNAKNASVASDASVKALTAVKASRAELQERREEEQKRKQEHENEVKRKKEAMLQAKIEEQKRKREEKQMKAQKAREAKEREKEEKIRKIIQEKEEKLQKEEQMKREWANTLAKKAAEEEKMQQLLKAEKMEQKRKLNKKPPPLPTDDLQDTDEEDENPKHKYVGPLWSQRQNLYPKLHTQRFIPSVITREFFQMQAQTPNLLEIFETVNEDILRRNSSAVWRTPPRYSTLPKFN